MIGSDSVTFAADFADVNYPSLFCNTEEQQVFYINGKNIYTHGVKHTIEFIAQYLKKNKLQLSQYKKIFLHQANERMLKTIRVRLNLDEDIIPSNVADYWNTASASPFILLAEQYDQLNPWDRYLVASFGAWFSLALLDCEMI